MSCIWIFCTGQPRALQSIEFSRQACSVRFCYTLDGSVTDHIFMWLLQQQSICHCRIQHVVTLQGTLYSCPAATKELWQCYSGVRAATQLPPGIHGGLGFCTPAQKPLCSTTRNKAVVPVVKPDGVLVLHDILEYEECTSCSWNIVKCSIYVYHYYIVY